MSRLAKFKKNVIITSIYQIVLIISGFITVQVILENYGSEMNGFINSITQIFTYFKLVEGGLSAAAVYALFKPLANKDILERNAILTASKIFYLKAGHIFLGLVILLAFLYPSYIQLNDKSYFEVSLLIVVIGFNTILEFYTLAKYRVLLTADQRNYIISLASIVHLIVNTIIIVSLAYLKVDFLLLWICATLSIFVRSIILILYTKRNYSQLDYNHSKPNFKALDQKWASLYNQVLNAIQLGAPIILLTLFTKDLVIVSIYVVYNLVLNGVNGVLNVFKTGIYSGFGDMLQKGNISRFQKAFTEFEFAYHSLIMVIYTTTSILLLPFITIYTKSMDVNYVSPVIGILFILNSLLYNIKVPQGMLIHSSGKFKETRLQVTIQGAILIIFGVIFTPIFGLVGVLLASIISNLYRVIDMGIYVPRNISKLSVKNTFIRYIRTIISIVLLVGIFSLIFEVKAYNYVELINYGLLALIISCIGVILNIFLFDLKFFKSLFLRLFKK